jgi:hypothetical protein
MRYKLIIIVLTLMSQIALGAEITIVPGDTLYMNATNPGKNYLDLVMHSVLISTDPDETFTIHDMQIDLSSDGQSVLSKSIAIERLVGETQGLGQMVAHGMGVFLHAQILSEDGMDGLFGRKMSLASSATLGSNEVLMLTRQHFSLDFAPDKLRITIHGTDATGARKMISSSVPVVMHNSPIKYESPVNGRWLMTSLPSIQSHHRLNPPTEFAVDFFKTNGAGNIHDGDELDAENYFGYGADVLAAADGEVVFVIADVVQARSNFFAKTGESEEEAGARIGQYNMRRYATDFARAAAGNIIAIKHEVGGVTEYSSYGHLKSGSVKVEVGDIVKRGQVIAEVGDTGDSAAVHLHFQINSGANAFMSRSVPVMFSDLQPTLGGVDPGRFVGKAN